MGKFNIKVFRDDEIVNSQNDLDEILNLYQVQLLQLSKMLENEFENIPLFEIQLIVGDRIFCKIPELFNIERVIYL